jgi:leader peptidase (prepilin peptidase) / N-methyltransferase
MNFPLTYPPFEHWVWLIPAFWIGACIGSFLNVVIYRLPLGLSVNSPKRSFCPLCKKPIPMWLNVPLVSWLWLRGRCRDCAAPIAFRYFGVELLTGILFTAAWWIFAPQAVAVVLFLWVLFALLVAITFIDAEHLIIPTSLTWGGSICGLLACAVWPDLPNLAGYTGTRGAALVQSLGGWVLGFGILWVVVELGKKALGKKSLTFEQAVPWSLREAENEKDPLHFLIGEESIPWWDIFSRKTDQLRIEATSIRVSGQASGQGTLLLREAEIELPDGTVHLLAEIQSLDGMATSAVIPREAMGMGDAHLLAMIGAFFGWGGVVLSLFASSIFALIAAAIGRIGFGKQLPFGPFLAMGALAWLFGGWKLWHWYLSAFGLAGM